MTNNANVLFIVEIDSNFFPLFVFCLRQAGDIVVTNNGTCKLQENCFTSHSSGAPGTVFVEEGSTLGTNTDNFGASNAAGSFAGGPCNAIFEETGGTNCLGGAGCNGYCKEFESTTCPLEGITTANAAAPRPVVMPQEVESKSNLVRCILYFCSTYFLLMLNHFASKDDSLDLPTTSHPK